MVLSSLCCNAGLGNFTKAVGKGMGNPCFRIIQTHFAKNNNVGDVAAKEQVRSAALHLQNSTGQKSSCRVMTPMLSCLSVLVSVFGDAEEFLTSLGFVTWLTIILEKPEKEELSHHKKKEQRNQNNIR